MFIEFYDTWFLPKNILFYRISGDKKSHRHAIKSGCKQLRDGVVGGGVVCVRQSRLLAGVLDRRRTQNLLTLGVLPGVAQIPEKAPSSLQTIGVVRTRRCRDAPPNGAANRLAAGQSSESTAILEAVRPGFLRCFLFKYSRVDTDCRARSISVHEVSFQHVRTNVLYVPKKIRSRQARHFFWLLFVKNNNF